MDNSLMNDSKKWQSILDKSNKWLKYAEFCNAGLLVGLPISLINLFTIQNLAVSFSVIIMATYGFFGFRFSINKSEKYLAEFKKNVLDDLFKELNHG